jgi:N-acetylneuraminic acid mutarotase
LFGGFGLDANVANSALNDLWEFSPATNEWIWVKGSSTAGTTNCSGLYVVCGQQGVYGILGTPSPSNAPGGRANAVSWSDTSGNLWLFGGLAFDSIGTFGYMNDLWKFDLVSQQWTWVSGSNTVQGAQTAVYGTRGIAAPGNVPLGLTRATGWIDKAGNLWLFGGSNIVATGVEDFGIYNNLWEFTPSTGLWKWVSGGGPNYNQPPSYGVIGVPSASNDPGAREGAVGWLDGRGKLWLFGGTDGNEVGPSVLNDLWSYDPSTGEWTWLSGSDNPAAGTPGHYGTTGVASAANVPGGRYDATGWIDNSGKIWLFGGNGYDSTLSSTGAVQLNDLWEFDPSITQWTWVSGSNVGNQPGTYGTKGTASANDVPGGRYDVSSWIDNKGNFWVFAGWGYDNNPTEAGSTILNDLWRYQP